MRNKWCTRSEGFKKRLNRCSLPVYLPEIGLSLWKIITCEEFQEGSAPGAAQIKHQWRSGTASAGGISVM